MREKASRGLCTFALRADTKEAHRQISIDPRDWHLLRCLLECGAVVFMNTVGTFGITSASYCWSRVASAIGRLTQYLVSDRAETWHMVVADDYHLEAGRTHFRLALMMCLSSVPQWERRSPGTRQVEVTLSSGSGANFSIGPDISASRSAGLSGS